MRRFAPLIKSTFFDWRRFLCYLLIAAVMLITRTVLLKIFVNIIRILMPLRRSTWDIIERFQHLDLSDTDILLAHKYSRFGPAPRTPSCMQRSYLLSIDFKASSITEWASQLKMNPLFAILSGFQVGDTPGVAIHAQMPNMGAPSIWS